VQWSPFGKRDYWVVSTSNQKALVWNLGAKSWQDTIQFVLHAHTRAITDINFSAHDLDMVATCAVDSFVHAWDLRIPLRPAFSVSDWFAGATQVKWSRKDEHVLASAHDKFLHIWDKRHGAVPVRTIDAHGTKIYGIDWNRFETHKVVTCSLDRTIKFWDTRNTENEPERVIETPFPVWRARHTPFGWGMMAMPQRGSSDLSLYDRRPHGGSYESGHVRPVARFPGHVGQVKEFLWRARGSVDDIDHREFQLITWGTDQELRLHKIDHEAMEGVGYEKDVSKTHRLNFTRKNAPYRTFRDHPDDVSSPIEPGSRGESLPSQNQIWSFRKRTNTAVGMSKVPVSQLRGWGQGERRTSRIAMHGKSSNNNEINPIAWLKNVKIATWDPDTLAEEIRHVGEKFKRVDFEVVDIKHKKLVLSLQAPWREHETSIYLRVDVRFPKLYPREANAIITLQKTGAIEDDLHSTLSKELRTIAEVYASQKRGCLEAVLRYLLREQSLEQIVTWVMGESIVESKIIEPDLIPAEDSSDSDDDNLPGLGTTLASTANVRVPLAKGCGALWAENGTLVCFFPPKMKEPDSVFGSLSVQTGDRYESNRLFEGFGRLHTSSPARKPKNGTRTVDEDSDSGSSDDSLLASSSSSSSTSSEPETELNGGILPYTKALPGLALHRSRSIDYSNRSTTMAGARFSEAMRKSVLSLHTYDDLLPSRKDLASQYQILGPGPEVCIHNASVARNVGRDEVASVWNLASMILSRTIPLELASNPTDESKHDILVIAKRASSVLKRKDSGVDLADGMQKIERQIGLAQIRWGTSPLAAGYLIPAMFDYFERIADVQMLAMLSCVFANSPLTSSFGDSSSFRSNRDHQSRRISETNRFYASESNAESLLHPPQEPDAIWTPSSRTPRLPRLLSSSDDAPALHSRRATTASLDPSGGYRYMVEAPQWSRAPSLTNEELSNFSSRTQAVPLSTSPEGNRFAQRSSTSGNLSTAQASLSALTQTFSHSPPVQSTMSGMASSLKKYSPSSSLTPSWSIFASGHGPRAPRASVHYSESSSQDKDTGLRSSASLANIRSFRKDGGLTPEAGRRSVRSFAPSEASDNTRKMGSKKGKKIVKTVLHNPDKFDLDSHISIPLLDPCLEARYRGYRASYAHLLDVWQLHVPKAEILKIDGFAEQDSTGPSPVKYPRRKTLVLEEQHKGSGLQILRTCQSCGDVLGAIEKNGAAIGWHCINAECISSSRRVSKKSTCAICQMTVDGLSIPCLQCGHITCYDCGLEWFGTSTIPESKTQRQRRKRRTSSKESIGLETIESGEEAVLVVDEEDLLPRQNNTCPAACGCSCPTISIHPAPPIPTPMTSNRTSIATSILPQSTLLPGHGPPLTRTTSHLSTSSQGTALPASHPQDTAFASFLALTRKKSTSAETGSSSAGMNMKTAPVVESSPPKAGSTSTSTSTSTSASTNTTMLLSEPNPTGQDFVLVKSAGESNGSSSSEGSSVSSEDRLLNPWAGSKIASLGRGIGGGLSRGLRERGSDSTIRRVG
jgi:hypothetical protein